MLGPSPKDQLFQTMSNASTGYSSDAGEDDQIDRKKPSLYARDGDTNTVLGDFRVTKLIGKGTFGKVYLIERKNNSEILAMKVVEKNRILDEDLLESAKLENEIL